MSGFDRSKFVANIRAMNRLKRMKYRDLIALHQKQFEGTKWYTPIKSWMTRRVAERRLWLLWQLKKGYHFPPDHPATKHFRRRANEYLSPSNFDKVRREEETIQKLLDLERFTKAGIQAMNTVEVDRFLVALNINCLDEPEDTRRKVLWEYFNIPKKKFPATRNKEGRLVRATRKGRFTNKYILRDIVLKNPSMSFLEFRRTFGPVMPTVTSASFRYTRWLLRKAGFDIPKLKRTSILGGEPLIKNEKKVRKA